MFRTKLFKRRRL